MIRAGLIAIAAAMLAACASSPSVPLKAEPAERNVIAVATLATNDCEAQTASTYTAAIMSVKVAADRVRKGTLPVAQAEKIKALGTDAKAWLDGACPAGKLDTDALASAQADVKAMQDILWSAP